MATKPNKIVYHWTGGTYHPNQTDYKHYHYLITDVGLVVQGDFTPEDNLNCTKDGTYAEGARGCNTGAIHVAFCGMYGFESPDNVGLYPLKQKQCEAGFNLGAELCHKYDIPITEKTVFTHYEFECRKGRKGRKIDIICLPYTFLKEKEVGNYIRHKINYYFKVQEN